MSRTDPFDEVLRRKKMEGMSPDDLDWLIEMGEATGRSSNIAFIDDPDSPEGRAITDYIAAHNLLPPDYQDIPAEKIEEEGRRLLLPGTRIQEQKRIVMLLAHYPSRAALSALESYAAKNLDVTMATWARMAREECRGFIHEKETGERVHQVSLTITRVGRNDPCPCGSGKKYKKCCGTR